MMSYSGCEATEFKMMPIREFMLHFDEGQGFGYLKWEEYLQREEDSIPEKDLLVLKQAKKKYKEKCAIWFDEYNKTFIKNVDEFVRNCTNSMKGQFNIVPGDINK